MHKRSRNLILPNLSLISAQKSLGEGLTADFLKNKADRDLSRSMTDGQFFLDHATTFAITISHVMDWVYYLEIVNNPQWVGWTCDKFRKWNVAQHEGVGVFLDIANEFKHASRNPGASKLLAKLDFDKIEESSFGSATKFLFDYSINNFTRIDPKSGKRTFIVPMIRSFKGEHFYKQVADDTVSWWRLFDSKTTMPRRTFLSKPQSDP